MTCKKDSWVKCTLPVVVKKDDTMRTMLSDIHKNQCEKLHNCQDKLTNLLELKAFADGFCLAVKIMVNVMNTMEILSIDD